MKQIQGDIWKSEANAICIPTNGIVKANGDAVMGAGLALQATMYYPPLPKYLGHCLQKFGNQVFMFPLTSDMISGEPIVITFPTKNDWKKGSRIDLIQKSANELVKMADGLPGLKRIAIPRVGCGKGGLKWEQVCPLLQKVFDDRFEVWER